MKKTFVVLLLLLVALSGRAQAQSPSDYVTADNNTGVVPTGSYAGSEIENIDLYNLNLNLTIPLFSLTDRNGFDVGVIHQYNAIQREWVER